MTFVAHYTTIDKVELLEDIHEYQLGKAFKEAKRRAKANGWTLTKVESKRYLPTPQIVNDCPHERKYRRAPNDFIVRG